jgi:hypothetical protein
LLDKRLDEFVDSLPACYNVADVSSLPRYFKEALLLHGKMNEALSDAQFADAELEKRYAEFVALEREHKDLLVRSNYLRRSFGDTYWWYYLYGGN